MRVSAQAFDTRPLGGAGIVTIDVCPACGYPTVGPDLCAFCRPLDGEWMPTPFDDVRNELSG